jgi:hypothetical protein
MLRKTIIQKREFCFIGGQTIGPICISDLKTKLSEYLVVSDVHSVFRYLWCPLNDICKNTDINERMNECIRGGPQLSDPCTATFNDPL